MESPLQNINNLWMKDEFTLAMKSQLIINLFRHNISVCRILLTNCYNDIPSVHICTSVSSDFFMLFRSFFKILWGIYYKRNQVSETFRLGIKIQPDASKYKIPKKINK